MGWGNSNFKVVLLLRLEKRWGNEGVTKTPAFGGRTAGGFYCCALSVLTVDGRVMASM